MKKISIIISICIMFFNISYAKNVSYTLDISNNITNKTKSNSQTIAVNNLSPAPTLYFTEGDLATITVKNSLKEETSIHWHGLIIPNNMDGSPDFGSKEIPAGGSFTYNFTINQSGTYWYHSHTMGQEADGLYGAIVIKPKTETIKADRDYTLIFYESSGKTSDKNLEKASNNHSGGHGGHGGGSLADLNDLTFLINGKDNKENWTAIFKTGEKVRLRLINASSSSIYDFSIPELKFMVVAADGANVKPVLVDELRFSAGETYDIIVEPKENKAYAISAESIDRSGFALGTLAPKEGMVAKQPKKRPTITMNRDDMMGMMGRNNPNYKSWLVGGNEGWAYSGDLKNKKKLSYLDLEPVNPLNTKEPQKEIIVTLDGGMMDYKWAMNDKVFPNDEPIKLKKGEVVKITFINRTNMAHPMHLHGMYFELKSGAKKHTVLIPPGQTYSVVLNANSTGKWAFHCHIIYHMMSGMMTSIEVS